MIVMLALLNDGAILSIAYDKVRYRNEPEAWNMRMALGIATVLGNVSETLRGRAPHHLAGPAPADRSGRCGPPASC